ncbi:MAG: hypothetical protein HY582_02500, partial [Candidatus Omnitrophica bacterium]|nr:hypothetical protein [Candidatus Omnitrophota bacterium]
MKHARLKIAGIGVVTFVISLLLMTAANPMPIYAEELSDVYSNFAVDTVMGANPPLPVKMDHQITRKKTVFGGKTNKGASMRFYPSVFDFPGLRVNPNEAYNGTELGSDASSEEYYQVYPPTVWNSLQMRLNNFSEDDMLRLKLSPPDIEVMIQDGSKNHEISGNYSPSPAGITV